MSFAQSKLSYSYKSVHFAAAFVSEQSRSFTVSDRQISVTFKSVVINGILKRTSHRTKRKNFFVFHLVAYYKHTVKIMVPVSRNFIQIAFCHIWSFRPYITAAFFFVFHKTGKSFKQLRTFRHQQRQTLTYIFVRHEIAQFSADFIVVAFFCFFHLCKIFVQVFFLIKSRAVNSCKHLIVFVTAPICTCKLRQLKGLYFAGRRQMRSTA